MISLTAVPLAVGAVPLIAGAISLKAGAVPVMAGAGAATPPGPASVAAGEPAGWEEASGAGLAEAAGTTCVTGSVPCAQAATPGGRAASTAIVHTRKNFPRKRFIGL